MEIEIDAYVEKNTFEFTLMFFLLLLCHLVASMCTT